MRSRTSLACDLPVVSVDVGDVRERIDGIEGCYLASADPDDLATKLRLVYLGPRRVDGHIKMRELSVERIALRLKEFYREVSDRYQQDARGLGTLPAGRSDTEVSARAPDEPAAAMQVIRIIHRSIKSAAHKSLPW